MANAASKAQGSRNATIAAHSLDGGVADASGAADGVTGACDDAEADGATAIGAGGSGADALDGAACDGVETWFGAVDGAVEGAHAVAAMRAMVANEKERVMSP